MNKAVRLLADSRAFSSRIPSPVLELLRERDFQGLRRVADRFEASAHRLVLSPHDRNVLLSEAADIRAFLDLREEER
jgi:hypothetical protein